jgi:hypothetical protein
MRPQALTVKLIAKMAKMVRVIAHILPAHVFPHEVA